MPVVGEGQGAAGSHVPHLRQFLAGFAFGDGADNFHVHITFGCGPVLDAGDQHRVVDDRSGVRHAGYGGDTAGCCRHGAVLNIFLGFLARLPQMGMQVDKTRRYH